MFVWLIFGLGVGRAPYERTVTLYYTAYHTERYFDNIPLLNREIIQLFSKI